MQAQEVPPYTDDQQHGLSGHEEHGDEPHKKKSMLGKVKDKAKKLKTKIKKPKSPGGTGENVSGSNNESSSASSSDDESAGSEPNQQQQQFGDHHGEQRDVVVTPGLKGDAYEAIPDPHVDASGVQDRFGQLKLGDELEGRNLQQEVPSAPGQVSAGVTPYLASHNLGESPIDEGKNAEGKDLFVTPTQYESKGSTPMHLDQPSDVSKTSDNTAAWYTPTSGETDEQKPIKDRVLEGATAAKDNVAATAASGAGALGLKSATDYENVESKDTNVSGSPKSMFQQAKERMFGSGKKDEVVETGENKPTITGRAAGTVTGFTDTIASKLGYGSNKNLTGEGKTPTTTTMDTDSLEVDSQNPEGKPVLQKVQERAADATGALTSKLGYGEKQSPSEAVGAEVNPGDNKSYTQKAYEAAYGAKDAVAAKLGYGGTSPRDSVASETQAMSETPQGDGKSYLQKAQETAVGAKDVLASKLGYANRDLPTSATEGAYGDDQNVPASTAARFHPGEEDRALSQLITEKMSTGAATVKDTLMRPFGSTKSGPPTPTTTPPPSSAAAVEADPISTTVSGTTTTDVPKDERPGIVGKVTGAVTSLLGTSASGKKKDDEALGKAHEDSQAQAAPGVYNVDVQ